jgi:hypothetical protein
VRGVSVDAPDEPGDDEEPPEPGFGGGWCWSGIVGVETPEGECTQEPSLEIELVFDHPPTRDEIGEQLLDEASPWLAFLLDSSRFQSRFGANPPLCIIGEALFRC